MLHVDARDPTPIAAQLARSVRGALADGLLQPGDPLPTVRQLAVSLKVNANALSAAFQELADAGLVEMRPGLGAFVRDGAAGDPGEPDRRQRLRELEDRFLEEAARLGFSLDDVIIHLDGRRAPET